MNHSVWKDSVKPPRFHMLYGDVKTDVLIIGGGICGILCAYFLDWAGVDYLLAESGRIGQGITKDSTAKLTAQHGLIYSSLIKSVGMENAQLYLNANRQAIERFTQMSKNIDCDFEKKAAYTFSLTDHQRIEEEVRAINSLGGSADYVEKLRLPFTTAGAVKMLGQASFNPLKLVAGIAKGLNIRENTRIEKMDLHRAYSRYGTITARKIIVATHFPFFNKFGGYFAKLYQYQSHVLGLENCTKLDGMYMDESRQGVSLFHHGNTLLLSGGGHQSGKKGGGPEEVRQTAGRYFTDAVERYVWTAQDCVSLDGIPYIGQYSRQTPDLYVATGFNQCGMTAAMTAAMMLRDLVLERDNEYEQVFTPQRSALTPRLFINGFDAVFHPRRSAHGGKRIE